MAWQHHSSELSFDSSPTSDPRPDAPEFRLYGHATLVDIYAVKVIVADPAATHTTCDVAPWPSNPATAPARARRQFRHSHQKAKSLDFAKPR